MTLPIPFTFATQSGSVPASELDNNFSATNTSLTTPGTIVSANTTDLGTVQSNNINITGTTSILSFGSSAVATQPLYVLNFAAALTLTYNATSMILPTSANITTAAGDSALAWYLGSGNWQVLVYYRKSGSPLVSTSFPGAQTTLASASTTDLGAAGSFLVNITGTTSITSFGSSASASAPIYFLTFPGVLTLTYNATSLILPTSANITTAAGDTAVAQYLGSGNWTIISYQRKSGAPLAGSGSILSHVYNGFVSNPTGNTIAAGNLNQIPHGFGTMPTIVNYYLYCIIAQAGYSTGDYVQVSSNTMDGSVNRGFTAYIDTTNVNIRWGSDASNPIFIGNKSTGVATGLSYANWGILCTAYA